MSELFAPSSQTDCQNNKHILIATETYLGAVGKALNVEKKNMCELMECKIIVR